MPQLKDGFERFDEPSTLRSAVAGRQPVDARERESIEQFLAAFDLLDDPFDEHAAPTHVTASAIVTGDDGVVLHLHKRLAMWLQPGGHIDSGEMPWEAALREAREETGLPVIAQGEPDRLLHVDVHPGSTWAHPPRRSLSPHITLRGTGSGRRRESGRSMVLVVAGNCCRRTRVGRGAEGRPTWPADRFGRAVVADAAACARVYRRSKAFGLPEVPEPHTEAEVATWIADVAIPTMDVWVADLDGVVVGQVMLAPGWLHHLYIDPAWMGRRTGQPVHGPGQPAPTGRAAAVGISEQRPWLDGSTNTTASLPSNSPMAPATRSTGPTCATRVEPASDGRPAVEKGLRFPHRHNVGSCQARRCGHRHRVARDERKPESQRPHPYQGPSFCRATRLSPAAKIAR